VGYAMELHPAMLTWHHVSYTRVLLHPVFSLIEMHFLQK
jgi:hypothetical protein